MKLAIFIVLYWLVQLLQFLLGLAVLGGGIALVVWLVGLAFSSSDSTSKTTTPFSSSDYTSSRQQNFKPDYTDNAKSSSSDTWDEIGKVVSHPDFGDTVIEVFKFFRGSDSKPVRVREYTDKNGRYVPEHTRSKPQ